MCCCSGLQQLAGVRRTPLRIIQRSSFLFCECTTPLASVEGRTPERAGCAWHASGEMAGYFGVFAKFGQPPGWRYGEWDFRPEWVRTQPAAAHSAALTGSLKHSSHLLSISLAEVREDEVLSLYCDSFCCAAKTAGP